jgi:hypothetical protein
MRPLHVLVPLALVIAAAPALAQPKKAPTAAPRKGKPPTRPKADAPPGESSDNPYGGGEPSAEPAAAPPAPAEAPAAEAPTSSGDAKLDEPPPPRAEEKEGPKPSPLTPAPNEMGKGPPAPGPEVLDRLMSDIAALRSRVAALTTSLFSSKLRVAVATEGDDARIQSFSVTLDDGVVFQSGPGFVAEDGKVVFEHAVAPGSHVVGVEIERQDARGAKFRTWQTSRFAIQVPERRTLEASVEIEDDSDMAEDFPDDQDGEYDLSVTLRAQVLE